MLKTKVVWRKRRKNSVVSTTSPSFCIRCQVEDWRKNCCAVPTPNSRKANLPATVGFVELLCFPGQILILLTLGRTYVHNRAMRQRSGRRDSRYGEFPSHQPPRCPWELQRWNNRLMFLPFISFMDGFLSLPPRLSLSVNGIYSSLPRQSWRTYTLNIYF